MLTRSVHSRVRTASDRAFEQDYIRVVTIGEQLYKTKQVGPSKIIRSFISRALSCYQSVCLKFFYHV